ncbi:hypothetical protein CsSME_00008150 [Camellia sinensis var. sinensis]
MVFVLSGRNRGTLFNLGVDHTDVTILMLAWKMNAQKQGYFTQIQNDYKVIKMDQWTSFLRFCSQISFPDLKNYDTIEAWPLILDDFVECMREEKLATTES